jgi:putative membrane protein
MAWSNMRAVIAPADRARIEEAVRLAEQRTSAEFVCVVMRQADEWNVVPLLWAALVALAVPWPLAMFTDWPIQWVHAAQLLVFLALWLVMRPLPVRMRLVPRNAARQRAHQAAAEQFMVRGLGGTHGRTGVLVFVAIAERYACVMPDAGIEAALPGETWKKAIVALTDALHQGRAADGLIGAVESISADLSATAPPSADDRDELPNKVIEL